MKKLNKKGVIYTWIMIIVALFTVMIVYVSLDQAIKEAILPVGRTMGVNNTTLNHLENAWNAAPFIFFISLGLLGIIAAILTAR